MGACGSTLDVIGEVPERKLTGTRLSAAALSELEQNLDMQKEELKRASIKHAAAVEALDEADEESKRAHEAAEKELREAEEAHAQAEKEKAEHEEALRLEREAEIIAERERAEAEEARIAHEKELREAQEAKDAMDAAETKLNACRADLAAAKGNPEKYAEAKQKLTEAHEVYLEAKKVYAKEAAEANDAAASFAKELAEADAAEAREQELERIRIKEQEEAIEAERIRQKEQKEAEEAEAARLEAVRLREEAEKAAADALAEKEKEGADVLAAQAQVADKKAEIDAEKEDDDAWAKAMPQEGKAGKGKRKSKLAPKDETKEAPQTGMFLAKKKPRSNMGMGQSKTRVIKIEKGEIMYYEKGKGSTVMGALKGKIAGGVKGCRVETKKENPKLNNYECVVKTPHDEHGLELTFEAKDKDGNPNEDLAQFITCLTAHIDYYKEVPDA